VFAVVAGIIAVIMLLGGTSVRDHVDGNYARAAAMDQDGDAAYTSALAPSVVTAAIVGAWKPVSQYADTSGVYLRYNDDLIYVRPEGKGSVIRVDDVDRGYRRYYSHVGGVWGVSSGHGESFRGRGPGGAGK
jgi:hypothetical protein